MSRKTKLSYFGHHYRQESLQQTPTEGVVEGEYNPSTTWIDNMDRCGNWGKQEGSSRWFMLDTIAINPHNGDGTWWCWQCQKLTDLPRGRAIVLMHVMYRCFSCSWINSWSLNTQQWYNIKELQGWRLQKESLVILVKYIFITYPDE